MRNIINRLHIKYRRFRDDVSGATAIEYGLLAALISVAIIAMLLLVGTALNNVFNEVQNTLTNPNG